MLVAACSTLPSKEKKVKREYFTPRGLLYPTLTEQQPNEEDVLYETGRTLKRKESNASIIKQLERKHPDGSYNYE